MSELNRKEFMSALDAVSAGLADKESVAQSRCFVFEDDRLYTFNSVIGVCIPYKTGLTCAVDSSTLLSFVRKLKSDSIILELEKDTLTVQGNKRAKAVLPVNASITLPFDKNVKPPEKLSSLPFEPKAFSEGVASVLFTVCNDTQMAQLCGVHVGSDSVGTFVETADRERATRRYVSDSTKPIDINIPLESAKALRGLEPKSFGFNEGWEYFKCSGGVLFASSMAELPSPNPNEKVLQPLSKEKRVTVKFPSSVQSILDIAVDFAVDGMQKDGSILVTVKDGRAFFKVKGDFGDYSESCKVESDGNIVFRTHPSKMIEALNMSRKFLVGDTTVLVKGAVDGMQFWHSFFLDVIDSKE